MAKLTEEEKKQRQEELDNNIIGSIVAAGQILGDDADSEENIVESAVFQTTVHNLLLGLTHKISEAQLDNLVEENKITEALRDLILKKSKDKEYKFIRSGATRSGSSSGGSGLEREYPAKFEKFNPDNKDAKESEKDAQMIELGKSFQTKLRHFLTGKDKEGNAVSEPNVAEEVAYFLTKGEDFMTYFRTFDPEEEAKKKAEKEKKSQEKENESTDNSASGAEGSGSAPNELA